VITGVKGIIFLKWKVYGDSIAAGWIMVLLYGKGK